MGRRKGSSSGVAKSEKKAPMKLDPIPRIKPDGKIHEAWKIMEEYIAKKPCFERLRNANIRLYWTKDWKPDVDGVVVGAQVSKASERERLDADRHKEPIPDAQIILPKSQWPTLSDVAKRHRVFHELCHVAFRLDSNGEVKLNTRDWPIVRMRRHPIVAFHEEVEEFGVDAIIGRNGATLKAMENADRPIIAAIEKAAETSSEGGNGKQPKAWRKWDTSMLTAYGLQPGKVKLLEEAGLGTLGKLIDSMDKADDSGFWWKSIKGLGEGGYDSLVDAMMRLRKAKPELQAEESFA